MALMNQEPEVVFLNENTPTIPLFVDERTNISCMGVYSWNLNADKSEKCFSYFPIIAQPLNFKNVYISMCLIKDIKENEKVTTMKDFCTNNAQQIENNKMLNYFLNDYLVKHEKIQNIYFSSILNFDPYKYECASDDTATFLYLSKGAKPNDYHLSVFSETELEYITKYILNPLGIGIFFSRSAPFLSPVTDNQNLKHYIQTPFSMEIIDTLLYRPTKDNLKEDISITDAISIFNLKYPMSPIFIHNFFGDKILHRLIFGVIMLKNHPPIKKWVTKDNKKIMLPKHKKDGKKVDKFTWIFIYLKSKPNAQAVAVINNSEDKNDIENGNCLNLCPWNSSAKVVKIVFNERKAAIMSPYDGYLSVNSDIEWTAYLLSSTMNLF